MGKKFLFLFLIIAYANLPGFAEPSDEIFEDDFQHEEYKKLIREKTRGMKNDAKVIKDAISDDFKSSTEELRVEYKKLEKLYDEFNTEMIRQQKALAEQKAELTRKFKKRQKDLDDLIHSMLEE
jgi:Skp family chaperone for outer membrane proteins